MVYKASYWTVWAVQRNTLSKIKKKDKKPNQTKKMESKIKYKPSALR